MKNKKNILIAYQYLSFKGGIEEVIHNQSKLLKEMGYRVSLLTSFYKKGEPTKTADNILIHRVSSMNTTYKLFGIPFALPLLTPKNIHTMVRQIKKADVVNVHGHPYLFSFLCVLLANIYHKPVVLTQHNTKIESKSAVMNILSGILDATFGQYNLRHSASIIAVSEETKRYIETISDSYKVVDVVYNGVDTKRFAPTKHKTVLRKKHGIPTNKFVCFTVRRLTFKNGIETFLETAKLANQKNTLFLLGGTGPEKKQIEEYIIAHNISNVRMLGFVKDEDLASYYALSDVFLLPSIHGEGFPMVVLESFACGTPVIATNSGGHTEIIENGTNGYIVDVHNPKQMLEKIMYVKSRPRLLKTMAKNCRSLVVERFQWSVNCKQFVEVCMDSTVDSINFSSFPRRRESLRNMLRLT